MDNSKLILQQQAQILERLASVEDLLSSLAGKGHAKSAADEIVLGATDPLALIREQNARRLKSRGIKTKGGRRIK